MVLSFNYKRIERRSPFPPVYAPAIPVTLQGDVSSLDTAGLVDSGADFSALPYEMAEVLGLDLTKPEEEIGGVGGCAKAVPTRVTLILTKGYHRYTLVVPVYAVKGSIEEQVPVLLGRQAFFERFKITFDEKKQKVILNPYSS